MSQPRSDHWRRTRVGCFDDRVLHRCGACGGWLYAAQPCSCCQHEHLAVAS